MTTYLHFKRILIILLPSVLLASCNSCDRSQKGAVVYDTVADTTLAVSMTDTNSSTEVTKDLDNITSPEKKKTKSK